MQPYKPDTPANRADSQEEQDDALNAQNKMKRVSPMATSEARNES